MKSSLIFLNESAAPGLTFSSDGAPDHRVISLRAIRSTLTPPKIIAPRRPLPTGKDSSHRSAGCLYHNFKFSLGSVEQDKMIILITNSNVDFFISDILKVFDSFHFYADVIIWSVAAGISNIEVIKIVCFMVLMETIRLFI
jgi:hypothetical protein